MKYFANIKSILSGIKINQVRFVLASNWRKLAAILISLFGLAIFIAAEYELGSMIAHNGYVLAVTILIAISVLIVTIAYPFWGYAMWFFLTCYLHLFNNILPSKFNFDLNMFGILTLVLLLRSLSKKDLSIKPSIAEIFLVLFFIYAYILRRELGSRVVLELPYLFMSPLFYYFIAKNIIKEKKHIYWLMIVIIVTGVSFALMGIYEQVTGKMWLAGLVGGSKGLYAGTRSTGPAGHYYVYGNMMIIATLLCLHIMRWQQHLYSRLIIVACTVTCIIGLYYGYSRAPYAAFVLSIIIMLILANHTRRAYAAFIVIAVSTVLILLPIIQNRELQTRMEANTLDVRAAFNKTSMNMFKANYWFGVGRDDYISNVPKYIAQGHLSRGKFGGIIDYYSRPHSEYFLVLAELGITGFFLYFMTYFLFLIKFVRLKSRLSPDNVVGNDFTVVAIAFTLSVLLTMYTDEFGMHPYMYAIIFTIYAMVTKSEYFASKEKTCSGLNSIGSYNTTARRV